MAKIYSDAAKSVLALLETGELDPDLKTIQKAVMQRLRRERYMYNSDKFEVGVRLKVKDNMRLRYAPQYLKGAVLEFTEQDHYGRPCKGAKILWFERKPRGGFGQPPQYDVGSFITWGLMEYEVELYNSAEEIAKIDKQIEKIRQKHEKGQ